MGSNCYLVCGEDDFQVTLETRRVLDRLMPPEQRELGLEVVDGRVETVDEALATIRQTLESMSMDGLFGGDKVVWLREPAFLSNDRIAKTEAVKTAVQTLAAKIKGGVPEGQALLVSTFSINRGSVFFKSFGGGDAVIDLGSALKPKECRERAVELVAAWLQKNALNMTTAVRNSFIERVGADSRRLVSELEKLKCYCGDRTEATSADVGEIVSGGQATEIWGFLDAFASRKADAMLTQLRRLYMQLESPIRLVSSLETRVQDLLLVREALSRNWARNAGYGGLQWAALPPEIESFLASQEKDIRKWPPFRTRNLAMQAECWTLGELRAARHVLLETREKLVSTGLSQEGLLETGLIRALGARGRKN